MSTDSYKVSDNFFSFCPLSVAPWLHGTLDQPIIDPECLNPMSLPVSGCTIVSYPIHLSVVSVMEIKSLLFISWSILLDHVLGVGRAPGGGSSWNTTPPTAVTLRATEFQKSPELFDTKMISPPPPPCHYWGSDAADLSFHDYNSALLVVIEDLINNLGSCSFVMILCWSPQKYN